MDYNQILETYQDNEIFKSIFYGWLCLTPGQWVEMETYPEWWALRLWTRQN